jgi:hypothetical protein
MARFKNSHGHRHQLSLLTTENCNKNEELVALSPQNACFLLYFLPSLVAML